MRRDSFCPTAAMRLALAAFLCCLLALPARAETVEALWTLLPDGGTAVKLAMIGLEEGDSEQRLFRFSCDKWGAVDLVFFGEAGLVEGQDYELILRINGKPLIFSGATERAESGALLYWSATIPLEHPLFARLAKARRIDLTINGAHWRLPITQLDWSLEPFIEWCQDLRAAPRQ